MPDVETHRQVSGLDFFNDRLVARDGKRGELRVETDRGTIRARPAAASASLQVQRTMSAPAPYRA